MRRSLVEVAGLWKSYGLPLGNAFRKTPPRWALQDIHFQVEPGEALAIIGNNGAGKSTLLKVLAGVTPPSRGQVRLHGTIFPMIELNAGINKDLTGRENILLLGALLGISRPEMRAKLPEIEQFCQLDDWFDKPAWMYSSGMLARLGFAVAMNTDADILLVDEVLAVGDISFQRKSLDSMENLLRSGKAAIFVSHNLRQVERLCERALLLHQGRQIALGPVGDILKQYYEIAQEHIATANPSPADSLIQVTLQPSARLRSGESLDMEVRYEGETLEGMVELNLLTTDMVYVAGVRSQPLILGKNQPALCHFPAMSLVSGTYQIQCKIYDGTQAVRASMLNAAQLVILPSEEARLVTQNGLINMDYHWEGA